MKEPGLMGTMLPLDNKSKRARVSAPPRIAPGLLLVLLTASLLSRPGHAGAQPAVASKLASIGQTIEGGASSPLLSPDGRTILFLSSSPVLTGSTQTEGSLQLFAHDLDSGTTVLVTSNAAGTGGGDEPPWNVSTSQDAALIAFESLATNLLPEGADGAWRIFARHMTPHITDLVDIDLNATAHWQEQRTPNERFSANPRVTPDGRWIAFQSSATNLAPHYAHLLNDFHEPLTLVYLRDTLSNTTRMASIAYKWPDESADGDSSLHDITPDSRYVLYSTDAANVHVRIDFKQFGVTNLLVRDMTVDLPFSLLSANILVTDAGQEGFTAQNRWNPGDAHLSPDGLYVYYKLEQKSCWPDSAASVFLRFDVAMRTNRIYATNLVCKTPMEMSSDRRRALCLTGEPDGSRRILVWDTAFFTNQLVNINQDGTGPANGPSHRAHLSQDGSSVVFISAATDLTEDEVSGAFHLYHHDLASGLTRLITRTTNGLPSRGSFEVSSFSISGDGQRVVFDSDATDLAPGDYNQAPDVFLWDSQSGALQLISGTSPGLTPLTRRAHARLSRGSLSADGRTIAFTSEDQTGFGGDTNRLVDAFWWTLEEDAVLPLSATNDVFDSTRHSLEPTVNADGSAAALYRTLTDFSQISLYPAGVEVWHSSRSGTLMRIHDQAYLPGHGATPDLHGTQIAFITVTNGQVSVLSHDVAEATTRMWHAFAANQWDGRPLAAPRFSPDGTWLAYPDMPESSRSALLVQYRATGMVRQAAPATVGAVTGIVWNAASDTIAYVIGGGDEIWIYNLLEDSRSQLCQWCLAPSISADGNLVAYLQQRPYESAYDVLLRDMDAGTTHFITTKDNQLPPDRDTSSAPSLSQDGRFVVFSSLSDRLVPLDSNGQRDVFVHDRWADQIHLISINLDGSHSGNGPSSNPVLASNGRTLGFQSFASDLLLGDLNRRRDVFLVQLGGEDTDGDAMEDDWEMAHFNTLDRDGTGDFDLDGQTDLAEFQSGTDPTNELSLLRILRLTSVPGNEVVLQWSAVPGRRYQVQCIDEVDSPTWNDCGAPLTASSTHLSWWDTNPAPGGSRYYRVALLAP